MYLMNTLFEFIINKLNNNTFRDAYGALIFMK